MKLKIKSNVTVTPSIKDYIDNKIVSRLESFEDYIVSVTINLLTNQGHKHLDTIEILTYVKGRKSKRVNKVSVSHDDLYTAIDIASEKMVRQVRKFKEKVKDKYQEHVAISSLVETPIVYEKNEDEYQIFKLKKFELIPMFVEEAIEQMNLLNHNFFFYLDAAEGIPCVVYRRNDGNYGILES